MSDEIRKEREKRLKEHRRRSNNDILATRRGTKSARSNNRSSNSNRHFQPGWTSSTGTGTGGDNQNGYVERSETGRAGVDGQRGQFSIRQPEQPAGKVLMFPDKRQEDSEMDSQD